MLNTCYLLLMGIASSANVSEMLELSKHNALRHSSALFYLVRAAIMCVLSGTEIVLLIVVLRTLQFCRIKCL
jgi:hypothetical protein